MDLRATIRPESSGDYVLIRKVNDLAFGQTTEGALIEKLRLNPGFNEHLSLVAEVDGQVIGHILFFPISIRGDSKTFPSLALAPMAVLPEFQKKGIGGQLIIRGLAVAKEYGFRSVIVLGHQDYYPKFGFTPASKWRIKAPYDVSDEVFMAVELVEEGLRGVSGIVEYPLEFDEVE